MQVKAEVQQPQREQQAAAVRVKREGPTDRPARRAAAVAVKREVSEKQEVQETPAEGATAGEAAPSTPAKQGERGAESVLEWLARKGLPTHMEFGRHEGKEVTHPDLRDGGWNGACVDGIRPTNILI